MSDYENLMLLSNYVGWKIMSADVKTETPDPSTTIRVIKLLLTDGNNTQEILLEPASVVRMAPSVLRTYFVSINKLDDGYKALNLKEEEYETAKGKFKMIKEDK